MGLSHLALAIKQERPTASPLNRETVVIQAHRAGRTQSASAERIGPALVFERLWRDLGIPEILAQLLADRKFEFPVERAIFLTVLHRLFETGSDRAAEAWRRDYRIATHLKSTAP